MSDNNPKQNPHGTQRPRPAGGQTYTYRASGQPAAGQRPPKRRRRKLRASVRRALVLVVSVAMLLSLAWVITGFIERDEHTGGASSGLGGPASGSAPTPGADVSLPGAALPNNASWNFVGPAQQATEQMQIVTPDKRMYALPENGRVDMQYFNNVVFVGDSITQGLPAYIPSASYCAYLGVSPRAIYSGQLLTRADGTQEVPIDAIVAYQPDNVYVLLGTNAMVSLDDEALLAYYSEMLDVMRERLGPAVGIYVQSITPVLEGRSYTFDPTRIPALNDQLAKMAWEKGMYFVDLHEALAGDNGWLREDYGAAKDGYHLQGVAYRAWVEYLVTHTAYNPRHAHLYLEGSYYYQQTPPA